ncbi:MAG: MOSC domain-containing protein [Gemmatimonadaceae bacterium]|nr:MOSC domain-containing protein [Gemmatimonadaceae bacterium]
MTADSPAHTTARVAALTLYPLKSTAGIEVDTLSLDDRGAVGDRRWLLVDPAGEAITARETPRLLTLRPQFATNDRDGALALHAPDLPPCVVPVPDAAAPLRQVTIWGDAVSALDAGDDVAAWCSEAIGRAARLVRLDDGAARPLKPKYAGPLPNAGRRVAFTDGAPLMLLGLASIAHLEERLKAGGQALPMDRRRFRANVWLSHTAPHEEDQWRRITIGRVELGVGSLCLRCVLTTVDPDTQENGAEPLREFAAYRRVPDGVAFGVNATHVAAGTLQVGDAVHIHETRAP